jgi:hypothetical protein
MGREDGYDDARFEDALHCYALVREQPLLDKRTGDPGILRRSSVVGTLLLERAMGTASEC